MLPPHITMATLMLFTLLTDPLNNHLNRFSSASKSVSLCCLLSYLIFCLVCLREYTAAKDHPCASTPGGHLPFLHPQPAHVLLHKDNRLGRSPARKPGLTNPQQQQSRCLTQSLPRAHVYPASHFHSALSTIYSAAA